MLWLVCALWLVLALLVAVVLGRGIRLADRRDARAVVLTTADLPADFVPAA
jgi:hypothetical protein